jgi:adenosine deaminase/aminodeoxyfutalosine deaminase
MAYKWVNEHIREPEHYALILRRLVESQHQQGCVYAEINLSIGVLLRRGLPYLDFFAAVEEEARRLPIPVRFVFDAVRQFGVEAAEKVAAAAIDLRTRGVVAVGVGGDEASLPLAGFAPVFREAKKHGLRFVPHAGETSDARAVWDALECGADRIGHGIRAVQDPALLERLAARQIPLEVCISSNLATRAVASFAEHPVRQLFEAGVPVILNTDDPPMFHCTLLSEYELAAREFGFSREELSLLAANSLEYAFR